MGIHESPRAISLWHLSCATIGGLCPPTGENRSNSGVAQVPYDAHTLSGDKKSTHCTTPVIKKDVLTQDDKPDAGCMDPLSLG